MGVATTVIMMGMALASGAMAYSSSRTQEKRAKAQGQIAAKQGELELRRSARAAREAQLELEDARKYQQWKEDFVLPVLEKSIASPLTSDPTEARARQGLARGIEVEKARGAVAQGVTGAGFDFGGARHLAADDELTGSIASASLADLGTSHELVKQQGISSRAGLVEAGRGVYKQQGII